MQARGTAHITKRLSTISTLEQSVTASTSLSADQKSALMTRLTSASDGLTALKDQIAGDTTSAAVRTDSQKVFTDFRVYRVLAPQVRGVERMSGLQAALTSDSQQLTADQAALDALPQGTAPSDAGTLLSGASTTAASTASTLSSTVDGLLSVTPAAYDADPRVLDAYVAGMGTAQTGVSTVGEDLQSFTDLHL